MLYLYKQEALIEKRVQNNPYLLFQEKKLVLERHCNSLGGETSILARNTHDSTKDFNNNFPLPHGNILVSLLPAFKQRLCSLNFNSFSIVTPSSFSFLLSHSRLFPILAHTCSILLPVFFQS